MTVKAPLFAAGIAILLVLTTVVDAQQPAAAAIGDRPVALVTGSTDGLGREVARRLAASGFHVIVHGRNRERGEALVREIAKEGKGMARFYAADLASLADVRTLGAAILRDYPRINVLINNAGIGSRIPDTRALSADGHELRFAVNYLSGFLLTRTLLPRIVKGGRIVNVSSGAQTPIDFDDVMLTRNYSGSRAYAQSKLAQVMFTLDLAQELQDNGIIVTALHPATFMATTMVLSAGIEPRSTIDEGATAVMHLVTGTDVQSGQYFNGLKPGKANAQAYDEAARAKLRTLSETLTGLRR